MAVIEDRVIWAIGFFNLIEGLRDQKSFQPIARHKGERAFKEIQSAERRKFIKHEQDALALSICMQIFSQSSANLIENETDERLGARNVRRRHDKVKRGWRGFKDQI